MAGAASTTTSVITTQGGTGRNPGGSTKFNPATARMATTPGQRGSGSGSGSNRSRLGMVTLTTVTLESRYNDAMPSSDLKSLVPPLEPENRREFLVHSLAVGFALAVQPIGAQTITTDTNGLLAG